MKFPAGKEETCSHNALYHQDHLDSSRLVTFFWFESSNILQQYIKYPKQRSNFCCENTSFFPLR